MLKDNVTTIVKRGIHHVSIDGKAPKRFRPWLGDMFSFLYDPIMERSIFPKKFGADLERHYDMLRAMVGETRERRILELATGTGSCVEFVDPDNGYRGTDISPGLLRRAKKRLAAAGFKQADLYLTPAEDLPFADGSFDLCLCILALNFFDDAAQVVREIRRVLMPGGSFICSVPVPERKAEDVIIRGTLHPRESLERMCRDNGFTFEGFPEDNGILLYFRAVAGPGTGGVAGRISQPSGNRAFSDALYAHREQGGTQGTGSQPD